MKETVGNEILEIVQIVITGLTGIFIIMIIIVIETTMTIFAVTIIEISTETRIFEIPKNSKKLIRSFRVNRQMICEQSLMTIRTWAAAKARLLVVYKEITDVTKFHFLLIKATVEEFPTISEFLKYIELNFGKYKRAIQYSNPIQVIYYIVFIDNLIEQISRCVEPFIISMAAQAGSFSEAIEIVESKIQRKEENSRNKADENSDILKAIRLEIKMALDSHKSQNKGGNRQQNNDYGSNSNNRSNGNSNSNNNDNNRYRNYNNNFRRNNNRNFNQNTNWSSNSRDPSRNYNQNYNRNYDQNANQNPNFYNNSNRNFNSAHMSAGCAVRCFRCAHFSAHCTIHRSAKTV
jgi:hypothetical protein